MFDLYLKFKNKVNTESQSRDLGRVTWEQLVAADFDFFINLYEDKDSFEEVSKPFLKDYFKELKFLQDYKI